MYADSIITRRIHNYERAYDVALREVEIPRVRELVNYLEGRPDASDPKRKRRIRPAITPEFRAFIDNELAMSKASFLYWARRYAFIQQATGDGGIDLFEPWESQLLLLHKIADAEEYMWMRRDAGDRNFDGICYFIHKARQLGFTMLCQLLLLHRALFYADTRTITASLDDQKTQDVHKRWSDAYDRLPWWMRPGVASRAYDRGKILANGSRATLQDFSQKTQLGQGEQWDCAHVTEVASVDDNTCTIALQNGLMPTIARSIRGMAFMESTAQGQGNWWHRIWKLVEAGEFDRWRPAFIPWYADKGEKNARDDVPATWEPDRDTLAHAKKVEETSPRWIGQTCTLTREQLYFYESKRIAYDRDGDLGTFLTNYCATPEESFQHSGAKAFDSRIIQLLTDRCNNDPIAYELGSNKLDRTRIRLDKNVIHASGHELVPVHMSDRDKVDPRGLILMFDRPRYDCWYSVGADPSGGIPGWHLSTRTMAKDEVRIDNAAISVNYIQPETGRTRQAAEFAAPVSPREFATYCLVMCRLFHGQHGVQSGAPLCLEVWPGPGGQTQMRLQYELGFDNFFRWTVFDGMTAKPTNTWGWQSSTKSVRELWIKNKEMIEQRETLPVLPQSPYLVEEMSYATWDPLRMRGMAMEGFHDDRVSAFLFSNWQLHDWSTPKPAPPASLDFAAYGEPPRQHVDYQDRGDIVTIEQMHQAFEDRAREIAWRRTQGY